MTRVGGIANSFCVDQLHCWISPRQDGHASTRLKTSAYRVNCMALVRPSECNPAVSQLLKPASPPHWTSGMRQSDTVARSCCLRQCSTADPQAGRGHRFQQLWSQLRHQHILRLRHQQCLQKPDRIKQQSLDPRFAMLVPSAEVFQHCSTVLMYKLQRL